MEYKGFVGAGCRGVTWRNHKRLNQVQDDCCAPEEFGDLCPGRATSWRMCGNIISMLPGPVDLAMTKLLGESRKEFRFMVDGDGEGNDDSPVRDFDREPLLLSSLEVSDTQVYEP